MLIEFDIYDVNVYNSVVMSLQKELNGRVVKYLCFQ